MLPMHTAYKMSLDETFPLNNYTFSWFKKKVTGLFLINRVSDGYLKAVKNSSGKFTSSLRHWIIKQNKIYKSWVTQNLLTDKVLKTHMIYLKIKTHKCIFPLLRIE